VLSHYSSRFARNENGRTFPLSSTSHCGIRLGLNVSSAVDLSNTDVCSLTTTLVRNGVETVEMVTAALLSWELLSTKERWPVFQPAVLCGGFEEVFKNVFLSLSLTLVAPQTTYIVPYDRYTKRSD
jgi:hypothetical protein